MASRLGKIVKLLLVLWLLLATGLGLAWVTELIEQQTLFDLLLKSGLLIGVIGIGALAVGFFLATPEAEKPRKSP